MSHVFVSYARSSEALARKVDDALVAIGHQVWRDDELPAHRAYAEVIEERLRAAAAVLVIWSADAARSHWVRAEADAARAAGTLVQMSIDGTLPPMPFNQIQCANLDGWNGDTEALGWAKVEASIAALVGGEAAEPARPRPSPEPRRHAILVLPFVNMSGDAEQEYFSDGISEDIITDLSKVSALSVTARNTAFTFKGKPIDVNAIGAQIGVSHVLEGSVRKSGNRVRITAQLIDAAAGDHLWAERWDRDLDDIFALQDEISQAIVAALRLRLLPQEKKAIADRGTNSPDAYDLYLLARRYWTSGNEGSRDRDELIIRLCRRALAIDPEYARAWALLALAQSNHRHRQGDSAEDGSEAADRALSIDPSLAEAHAVRAQTLAQLGDDGSAAAIARAVELDGESWEVRNVAGRLAFHRGDMREAVLHFEKAAALVETDNQSTGFLVVAYTALGDKAAANRAARTTVARAERAIAEDRSNGAALAHAAYSLACLGEADRAKDWIRRALVVDPDNANMRYNLACALTMQLGDDEAALDLLEQSIGLFSVGMVRNMAVDPDMDRLRGNPRFLALNTAATTSRGAAAD